MKVQGETLQFMQQLWNMVHALEVRSKRMARTLGVTGPQRLVIRIVGQHVLPSARELADTLGLHPSTLTGVLARLEKQKLIQRVKDPRDGRRARFRLTAAGHRVDRERKGTVEAAIRRALGRTPPRAIGNARDVIATVTSELARGD
jgi:DNA-binding MarR family transcriptional regulator